jgi:hypothetical protein
MEQLAPGLGQSGYGGKLRTLKESPSDNEELSPHVIVSVGQDSPVSVDIVPDKIDDIGLEAGVLVEVEVPGNRLAVSQDLRLVHVLGRRDVAHLFEEGQIDVRLDVALRCRIPVPVPGPPDISGPVDQPDALDTRFAQKSRAGKPGQSSADDGDIYFVGERAAFEGVSPGVVRTFEELISGHALRTEAPSRLLGVTFPDLLQARRVGPLSCRVARVVTIAHANSSPYRQSATGPP